MFKTETVRSSRKEIWDSMMKKIIKKINLYKERKYLSDLRMQNKNKDFTIVCNNCVGGGDLS